jgi:hypothetical protein
MLNSQLDSSVIGEFIHPPPPPPLPIILKLQLLHLLVQLVPPPPLQLQQHQQLLCTSNNTRLCIPHHLPILPLFHNSNNNSICSNNKQYGRPYKMNSCSIRCIKHFNILCVDCAKTIHLPLLDFHKQLAVVETESQFKSL